MFIQRKVILREVEHLLCTWGRLPFSKWHFHVVEKIFKMAVIARGGSEGKGEF